MKHLALALLITSFATGSAFAQSCATKALSKDGKPLAGAARSSFLGDAAKTRPLARMESRCPAQRRPAS
jgi:hypothetical protein